METCRPFILLITILLILLTTELANSETDSAPISNMTDDLGVQRDIGMNTLFSDWLLATVAVSGELWRPALV